MTKYKLQYWIYAILNKQYGKEVEIVRDPLHRRYDVNRHGFHVGTNTLSIKNVQKWLEQKLIDSSFKAVEGEKGYYVKKIANKKFYIFLGEQRYINSNKVNLQLSIHAYNN